MDTHLLAMPSPRLEPCTPVVLRDEWARGAFGRVYVVDTPAGRIAVKSVPETEGHVNRELQTCIRLASDPHPNVVGLLGYWTEGATLHLVMEFFPETIGGVLTRLAEGRMRMKTSRMTVLMGQLACALDHLERIHLMHRDLKPDNILVDVQTNRLALADFGSAKFAEPGQPNTTYICSRFYRAPELILGRDLYGTPVDIWAFGCVLAEFAYGRPLFMGDTQVDVMARIIRIRGMVSVADIAHMPTHSPETIDLDCVGVKCTQAPWSRVLTRRIGSKRVIASYGESYERVLGACLQWSPSTRVSAHDLRCDPLWGKCADAAEAP
jgi:serine/threonine protein kinase